MKNTQIMSKPLMLTLAIALSAIVAGCGGSSGGGSSSGAACSGTGCVNLGTAANYAVFANTGIASTTGLAVITGNIGLSPTVTSSAFTGFAETLPAGGTFSTSAQVNGNLYASDYAPPTPTVVNTASLDMGAAYIDAAGKPAGVGPNLELGGGTVTGQTLAPGTYTWGGNVTIPTDLTLNGPSSGIWIFQIGGTLGMDAAKKVILSGGALPQNIFWKVSGAVTIGATTEFKGIILGQTSITFGNQASVKGRLLAQTAVNLDQNTVTVP